VPSGEEAKLAIEENTMTGTPIASIVGITTKPNFKNIEIVETVGEENNPESYTAEINNDTVVAISQVPAADNTINQETGNTLAMGGTGRITQKPKIQYTGSAKHSGRKIKSNVKGRQKSNKRTVRSLMGNRKYYSKAHINRNDTNDKGLVEDELDQPSKHLNCTEIVPPINDPHSEVFSDPTTNILAKSRPANKKKKRIANHHKKAFSTSGVWSAFPGRKMGIKKGLFSRGRSLNSSRSSKSKRRFRNSSRSSKSSKSSSRSRYMSRPKVKGVNKRYIKNVLPHIQGSENKQKAMAKFTNPSHL